MGGGGVVGRTDVRTAERCNFLSEAKAEVFCRTADGTCDVDRRKNPPKNTKVTAQNTRCASLNDRPVDVFFFLAFWGCRRRRRTGESACVDRRSTFPQRFTDDQLEPGAAWPYLEAYAPYGFVRPPHASGSRVEDRRRCFLPGSEEQPESEICWGQSQKTEWME